MEVGGRGVRVRRLGGDRAGEIRLTRFLRNPSVSPAEMAASAARRTAERCAGRPVLAIQDTTVVRSEGGGGLYVHGVLAVDAEDGAILGLIDGRFLSRSGGQKALRRCRPIEEKESERWIEGAERTAEVCAAARRVTVIADREADIFEAFSRCPGGVDLLVRAAQDRSLEDGGRLFAEADALPPGARAQLDLPATPGERARTAELAVRWRAVSLARPRNGVPAQGPASVALHLVDLREVSPPAGTEPVHWRLLTTHRVEDAAEALAVADLYRRRWAIEQLFRTLKTQGFDIEGLRIEAEAPRCNLVMAALIAAVTVQQLVHARDGKPGAHGALRPIIDAFEPEDTPLLEAYCTRLEGKTARQKNPHPKASLAYAAWVCARLGGWTGYYGKPGPIVMLSGWLQFQAGKAALHALRPKHNV
ncbi:MAG TPA: IS4 family transposase [Azospirillaceae bacterium]|nr:IS4 family transposase [Azospirillaceae bacterium]